MVRPFNGVLTMSMLHYEDQMRSAAEFEVPAPAASDRKVKLAETLIEAATEPHFQFAAYEDPYRKKLEQLIRAKIQGKEVVAPPPVEEPQVINLMEALKRSIAKAQGAAASRAPHRRRRRAS